MVYQSPDPKVESNTAVVGVLYQIGHPDAFLSKVKEPPTLHHLARFTNINF